ncbi:MAG: cytochrome c oxidase subunit II [Prochloraceae cyanobacterium]|nr:cytochrome c oxidase subunit II [Prochloraceae cyanobacterium]
MKIGNILKLVAIALFLTAVSIWVGQLSYGWLPVEAAAESRTIDNVFSLLVTLGTFIFLGVTGTLMYSVIFHRAEEYDLSDGPHIEGNLTLEIVWTAIPILLVFWIAGYSYDAYVKIAIRGPMEMAHHIHVMEPAHAAPIHSKSEIEEIEVLAKQWAWVFRYPDKNITSTELHLPVNKRVRLALTSEDVLHGFYIPDFRVKQDIIPNESIDLEFTPIRNGEYRLTDSQFSGTYFATMEANVVVESSEDYLHWLEVAAKQEPTPAYNQAASEYDRELKHPNPSGWETIAPSASPIVNYHS